MHDPVIEANRRVLVIDDNPAIHEDFRKILGCGESPTAVELARTEAALLGTAVGRVARPTFELDCAFQGEQGLALIARAREMRRPYAVAFVDARMPPGWDGIETIRRIWAQDDDVQIVICTAYSDYSWGDIENTLGLSSGLLILKKPFDPIEVRQLAAALSEKWRLARQTSRRLRHLAQNDPLTGLPNRRAFHEYLSAAITRADSAHRPTALILLDIDDFTGMNQALGPSACDLALELVARRLQRCIPLGATAARIGNDEFALILESVVDAHAAAAAARAQLNALSEPMVVDGRQVAVTASIGLALYPTDADDMDSLIKNAELATHFAKRRGANRVQVYCPELLRHTEQETCRRARIDERFAQLTPREHEVMDLLVAGQNNKAIGRFLGVSPRTVEIHRAKVMQKMQADSLPELVRAVIEARTHRS